MVRSPSSALDGAAWPAKGPRHPADRGGERDDPWEQLEREERAALRRVAGLATELEDVSEVEYRQLRLERVVLVGLYGQATTRQEAEKSLRELAALAETAGAEVLDGLLQRRARPDVSTYLGSGKAAELAELVKELGADTVVADSELSPSQRRALEDVVKVKVIDRTAVILDIFAAHAKSKEGRAQVELAQLEYLLPRLRGWGESMSRQAGGRVAGGAGIGSRGPGETKIELDRRRIRTRIAKLRRELRAMAPSRAARRSGRERAEVPSVGIVGYTNAGKSSLLNALTGAHVLVDDQLFATLDPTVRAMKTADGRAYTITDTVGFVRRLPHELVEAFASTLEESILADVLLHVVDASAEDAEGQLDAVRQTLAEVAARDAESPGPAGDRPLGWPGGPLGRELVVFAKSDAADPAEVATLLSAHPGSVAVSSRTGAGLDELRRAIELALPTPPVEVDLVVPFSRGDLVAKAHRQGELLGQSYEPGGTRLRARVSEALAAELRAAAPDRPRGGESRR
ncbi:MAG: GTPase HflX [Bifidobacteriaceae bacterium]|jgi:GTP-binding protein HflX|nr:GTPase HflX [Bifidobacteriaceae bacterium]